MEPFRPFMSLFRPFSDAARKKLFAFSSLKNAKKNRMYISTIHCLNRSISNAQTGTSLYCNVSVNQEVELRKQRTGLEGPISLPLIASTMEE
jgi:hypothetical protein